MPITLPALCLVTLVLCNVHGSLEHEIPRRSFLSRRAIDGTRGRKYFDPEEEGAFDSYGSAGGQYDPYQEKTDFSDIRRNVPGEPGIDYPAYTTLPQTGFTCEGRSRGYYADEVSGCQVFHVCHDVLVSSFLCPIGSTFSQKLLTCDWWTKVDCSASSKYTDVNRNSYQQDDDEMIRNAYAMISLQSGTDVTKDGLVDPDRTGSIVDYQRGPGRTFDYSPVDATGNDLRTNFEDYPKPASRDFLPPYQLKDRKPETSRSYQEKYYSSEKSRSPYQDSPIIRVQKINDPGYASPQRNRDFEETYRRPNEFANQFQPSYAPTVPTVTTTTRRFYSPTVPTTFRPSTLAYNKLDQVIDSSDYYFSHSRSKSFVTPPTRIFSGEDKTGLGDNLRNSEASRKFNRDDDYGRQESYEDDYEDSEDTRNGRSREKFQVRVPDDLTYNQSGIFNSRGSLFDGVYRGFGQIRNHEEIADDFETRGSIGLGHALHESFRGISVQEQNPVKEETKAEEEFSHKEEIKHTLIKPESTDYSEEKGEETTEQYQRDTKTEREEFPDASDVFAPSTTPSVIESTIKASTIPQKSTNSSPLNASKDGQNSSEAGSEFPNAKASIDRLDSGFQTFRPVEFLKPPQKSQSKFQIKVPDLSDVSTLLIRYSTLDDTPYPGTRTTEMPRFQSTFSDDYVDQPTSFDENLGVTNNYGNVESSKGTSLLNYPTTVAKPLISSSGTWFPSSSPEPASVQAHREDYSESSSDFSRSNYDKSYANRQSGAAFDLRGGKNGTEEKIAENYGSESQFAVADAVQSNGRTTVSDDIISSPNNIKSTLTVNHLNSSALDFSTAKTFEESSTPKLNWNLTSSATKSLNIEALESTAKPVARKSIEETNKRVEDDVIEASTANALLRSIRPETLMQIEENIEKNNSPYQVTLTVNKDAELVPNGRDLISKLIAHQGKETSTLSDQVHELEVVKSMEPEIRSASDTKSTTIRLFDVEERSETRNNFSRIDLDEFRKKNANTVSLLQLMSELLKLDRIPRPFSLSDAEGSKGRSRSHALKDILSTTSSRSIAKDVNSNIESRDEATIELQESSTESTYRTSVPKSKEEILDQLEENFGQPFYKGNRKAVFDLPEKEKSPDFQSTSPSRSAKISEDLSNVKSTIPTTVRTDSRLNFGLTITTTAEPKTTLTTEKTVVKTEFVPSIGFSLNTDEGREEYVEAVLGGIIEPEATESEKKETILNEKVEDETIAKKNETSGKI